MDESDVERGEMTAGVLLAAAIGRISRGLTARGEPCAECEDCGSDIPVRRLAAVPGTRRCVDCQQSAERRH